ncbi:hypothetical protein GCM10010442_80660 [Kitasatospora kifunensis]
MVANNITDLAAVLTDPELCGFDPAHCAASPPEAGVEQVGDLLMQAAAEAEDLLLFYYSGHGLLGPRRRELYLSLAGTRPDRLAFTALPFEAVRDACLGSRARSRVVILDSCFSGRAIGETLADDAVLGQLDVAGTYTLTSAPANRTAAIMPGEQHTAFTERLLHLLRTGTPTARGRCSASATSTAICTPGCCRRGCRCRNSVAPRLRTCSDWPETASSPAPLTRRPECRPWFRPSRPRNRVLGWTRPPPPPLGSLAATVRAIKAPATG